MKVRTLLVTGAALAVVAVPSAAIATGEGEPVNGGERNPSRNAALDYTRETEIIADVTTYGTRQSNKRDGDGGGAIYGCRSNPGAEPCVRANNLKGGRAFEFATVGKEGGRITVGGDATGAPLTTNATGVATGFNADKVDGRDGADLASAGDLKFASVAADGKLSGGRGATAATLTSENDNTYTVTFDRDVSGCSFTANGIGGSTAEALGVQPAGDAAKNAVLVDGEDDADAGSAERGRAFHLQVIC